MRAVGAIDIKRGINQSAPVRFGWNADVEWNTFRGDNILRGPRYTAIKRAIERNVVRRVIVPSNIEFAIRSDRRRCADGFPRSRWIVRPRDREGGAVIRRAADANATAGRATGGCVPSD